MIVGTKEKEVDDESCGSQYGGLSRDSVVIGISKSECLSLHPGGSRCGVSHLGLTNSKERWAEKRENCAEENPLVDNGPNVHFMIPCGVPKLDF